MPLWNGENAQFLKGGGCEQEEQHEQKFCY